MAPELCRPSNTMDFVCVLANYDFEDMVHLIQTSRYFLDDVSCYIVTSLLI